LDVNGDQKVSELVLAIIRGRTRPEQAAEKAAENPARVERPPVVPPPTRSQPAQVAAFEPKATPSPKPPPDNSGIISRAVRTFVPPSQSAPREQAPRTIYVEPPEVRGATPMGSASPLAMAPAVRIPEPPPAPVRETPSQAKPEAPPAAVQPAPAQPAPAQQVPAQTASAQLAPAPAREPESKRAGASYVQPRPLRQSPPSVPPQLLRALIVKDTQVEVKAYVDATGKVTRAEVLSGVTHRLLINAVTEAAQRWTFAPAQMDGKPVAAEARIIFLFRVPPSQLRD
jgi:TonB family protein